MTLAETQAGSVGCVDRYKKKCRLIEQLDWDDMDYIRTGIKALPNWHEVADIRAGYADLGLGKTGITWG
jgi:hypothetical protein